MDFFKQNIIPSEVIIQILAFLSVFFLLRKLAWKQVQQALENRRNKIRDDFEAIEKAKQAIETLKTDYTARLQKIEDEARAKIQSAIEDGRKIAREIQDKAREDAQKTFEKSKENLEMEVAKARATLKNEVADLALRVAEKVVGDKMTEKEQQAKALRFIDELEKTL